MAKRILFVCTGNSCRSVMAEHVLRRILQQVGVEQVEVGSAGLFAMEGMHASRETQQLLREAGLDASEHRARRLTTDAVDDADLVFVMEPFQREELIRRMPQAASKVHLLKPYGLPALEPNEYPGIHDPIGKPMEVYEVCFTQIRDAIARVAKSLGVRAT